MALNLNSTTLQHIAEQAAAQAAEHPRWLAAIARAIVELNDNPFVERNPNGHGLIIGSTSGVAYAANGTCGCIAFQNRQPCYHRAMARIVRLCDEHEAEQARASMDHLVLEAEAIIAAQQAGLITMPEGDRLDTDGMRLSRKIAAARAQALLNECFA